MNREIKFYHNECFVAFVKLERDPEDSLETIQFWMGPSDDEQMETAITFTQEQALEILRAAIKLIEG